MSSPETAPSPLTSGQLSNGGQLGCDVALAGFTGPDIPGGDPLTPTLDVTLIPEPGTATLVALGLAGLGGMARQRRE